MLMTRILEASEAAVGSDEPSFVRAEIAMDLGNVSSPMVKHEWLNLKQDDTVFLMSVKPSEKSSIAILRVAEVYQVQDEEGRIIRTQQEDHSLRKYRLIVNLDVKAYTQDIAQKATDGDIYESINLLVRRNKRENNFKKVLDTIKRLIVSTEPIPAWFKDVFLGFGDPNAAQTESLSNQTESLDLRDTLIDKQHVTEALQVKSANIPSKPPYVLNYSTQLTEKKRRKPADSQAHVTTYTTPPSGPFPQDAPKLNKIRFTQRQVEAIISGTQRGLTVIVGPPGTGKTDVATQIINNLYHNHTSQRTLLVAHSNQALNQLFQKITCLDIDGRHLLRLGQGEGDLETGERFSKVGRVESFLENRDRFLQEVSRLAANLQAPGAHGSSCETAEYFRLVYVAPAWAKFWADVDRQADLSVAFPFHEYFAAAPQPLFPAKAAKATLIEIAQGCERHINKIFTELADIRPFEILRHNRDRNNYLMVKEARIIAMTSTHAAMRRQEIAELGFQYDNVVMEEAAQITEVENFIPLVLQEAKVSLQRIVLCGDHLQNSPIISNMAFRQFANLEQSLFLRLIRLGVRTIDLNAQGRARPSIAELYRWRYEQLDNLPSVKSEPEFLHANAGFRFEYQFIDVDDYKGKGESKPTPHFVQNLGEAEYAVALYQYMRLLGYPARKISILTTYAGQRALIRDVLTHRCANNHLFGMPRIVATVDKYQGEQNDYIILSLVRTTRPGYLRDLRRLTVALSRARLGLYILGRRSVFENGAEFQQAFALPLARPSNLMLTVDEMHPTTRLLTADVPATEMVGVEHLGQYVFEMTNAKLAMMQNGQSSAVETLIDDDPMAGDIDIDGDL